jgi:hypothetical protein
MLEPARRHGPFDIRYPARPKLAATTWELQRDEEGMEWLHWSAFLARFFPNRRRHDFEALAAYESYGNALEEATAPVGPEYARQVAAAARERVGVASSSAAELVWEWEGGAVKERVAD